MNDKLRLGVIGAGSWAVASHLPNLERRKDQVEFVAVNRRDRERLESIRDRFGFKHALTDYRDVIAAGIDICVVSSPPALHHEQVKAAMEGGAHVLVEKPFTIEPEDAWDLVETARRLDRHLLIASGWNYRPMVQQAKDLVEAVGGFGTVEQMMIDMSSSTREELAHGGSYPGASDDSMPRAETYTDPTLSGGGYAQDQLSHALGLALWLTGLRGLDVFAFMSAPLDAPVELHDAFAVRYEGGAIGTISGTASHQGYADDKHRLAVRVIGSRGQLDVDLGRELVYWYSKSGDEKRLQLDEHAGVYDCVGPIDALVDLALGRDVRNCSPGDVGARTVEILSAAYRSERSGRAEPVVVESKK